MGESVVAVAWWVFGSLGEGVDAGFSVLVGWASKGLG